MSRFIGRSLLVCSFLLVLTACQNIAQKPSESELDSFAIAEQMFAAHLADNNLDLADQQLEELREKTSEDQRFAPLQQSLATAWLETGEQALKDGDVEAASAALIKAKRLLPQAPALTKGLSTALAAAQAPVVKPIVTPPVQIKPPIVQKKSAQKKPPLPSAPQSEAEPMVKQPELELETQIPLSAPKRSNVKSRLVDVNAQQTVVLLPMLSNRNDHRLGRLLDDVAADVVRFRAAVSIEVADTRDFHWVAALLSARVKKLDANFKPRLQEVIRSDEPAQLIITPNRTF